MENDKPKAPLSVAVEEEEYNDSDLDQALAEEDPEFLSSISEIQKDNEVFVATQQEIIVEQHGFFKGITFRIGLMFRVWRKGLKEGLVFAIKQGPKAILGAIKDAISRRLEAISEAQRNFRYLSWKMKLGFFAILILMGGTGFFLYRSLTHGWVTEKEDLFMRSLQTVAGHSEEYELDDTEPFYENLRTSSNMLLIPKMVVNIKPSSKSGRNPMGAFEFYVEGLIPEVVVEVKDREIEIRDLMQRVVEGFTFDLLDSPEGKKLMCEKLQKEINPLLTTGKLKKIWIKTIILKP